MDHTKMNPKYLDSSCRELSVRGLVFVVALLVFFGNYYFVCVHWGGVVESSCSLAEVNLTYQLSKLLTTDRLLSL